MYIYYCSYRPKKKYVSTGEGRVNVSNITSRINSGIKKKKNAFVKAESRYKAAAPEDQKTPEKLYIAGILASSTYSVISSNNKL